MNAEDLPAGCTCLVDHQEPGCRLNLDNCPVHTPAMDRARRARGGRGEIDAPPGKFESAAKGLPWPPVAESAETPEPLDLDQIWREQSVHGDVIRGVVMGIDGNVRRLAAEVVRLRAALEAKTYVAGKNNEHFMSVSAELEKSEHTRAMLAQTIAACPEGHHDANLAHARAERDQLRTENADLRAKLDEWHRAAAGGNGSVTTGGY